MEKLSMSAVCYLAETANINLLKGDEIDSTNPRTLAHLFVALQLDQETPPTIEEVLRMEPTEVFEKVSGLLAETQKVPGKPKKKAAKKTTT